MRGKIEYQTAQLAKVVFVDGLKKEEKIDPLSNHYKKVASYGTMTTYRNIWNQIFKYIRNTFAIKDPILTTNEHISSYMLYNIQKNSTKQYLEKISSAIGKLEIALFYYTKLYFQKPIIYDFSSRLYILESAKNDNLLIDNYHNRANKDPKKLISNLKTKEHRLAATIQLQGGARVYGVSLIKLEQLKGIRLDKITNTNRGIIQTKEKGGKIGDISISIEVYDELKEHILKNNLFKISRDKYLKDISNTSSKLGIANNGSHGFRWNFAQNRLQEYANADYTYHQSLLKISSEMKHNRAKITEHYIG